MDTFKGRREFRVTFLTRRRTPYGEASNSRINKEKNVVRTVEEAQKKVVTFFGGFFEGKFGDTHNERRVPASRIYWHSPGNEILINGPRSQYDG